MMTLILCRLSHSLLLKLLEVIWILFFESVTVFFTTATFTRMQKAYGIF